MVQKCKGKGGECWCKRNVQDRFNHYRTELEELSKASPIQRMAILKKAPPCLIRLLSECGLNVLKGHVKLSPSQYAHLRPHRRVLLDISRPAVSLRTRREALGRKRGGFLPVILPILLSALSGFAGQAVAKAVGIS
jgi:hypothetical protein